MANDPTTPRGEPDAAALKVPDLQTREQWCGKCEAMVLPRGKGLCPRCGRFLREHFASRKHPVNILRRQQILDALVAEYRPASFVQRAWCEDLAGIREQLEGLKASGSTEWQRLTQTSQQLGALLEGSQPAKPTATAIDANISPDELERRALRLVEMARAMRLPPMSATPTSSLLGAAPDEPVDDADFFVEPDDDAAPRSPEANGPWQPSGATTNDVPTASSAAPMAPADAEPCPYCHRACVGPDHPAFAVMHEDDPVEVKRRSELANAVMMKMVKFGNPY